MDMQVANVVYAAGCGMMEAAELAWKAAQLNAEIQGMVAENKQREIEGKSMAHDEASFARVLEAYR